MATGATQTGTRQRVRITVSGDSMSATLVLYQPPPEQEPITIEEIMKAVDDEGIEYGLNRELIEKTLQDGTYSTPVTIAEGEKPERGVAAQFEYHFDTVQNHTPKEDEDGRIDYADISFIQNTTDGAVLVTKTPPSRGNPGRNIFGKEISGPMGADLSFKRGNNTAISEDGLTLRSIAKGAIVYQRGKVSVSDVTVIQGDVDFNVGNITCAGSVKITGGVKTGFKINVDGNLEIGGNVEDSEIDVKGNILVKGGFFGEGGGLMKAEGDVVLKYSEGQKILAGGDVIVGGEIINCMILSGGNVTVKGSKGKIVGGTTKALREVRAGVIGSDAGTKTLVHVGFDPEIAAEHAKITKEIARLSDDYDRIKTALVGLYRLELDGKLPPDKKPAFNQLLQFKKDYPDNMASLEKSRAVVEEKMKVFEDSCVVAEHKIYPGVRAYFGTVYREIMEERSKCKLMLDNNQVLVSALQ